MAEIASIENTTVTGNIVPLAFDSGGVVIILVPLEIAHSAEEAATWLAKTFNAMLDSGERVGVNLGFHGTVEHEHNPEPGSGNE